MKLDRRIFVLGALIVLTSAASPEAGWWRCQRPEPVAIRLAVPFAPGHILHDTSLRFKERIEARTKGRMTVTVLAPPGVPDSEEVVNNKTAAGEVDIAVAGGRPIEIFAPQYFFFNGPYVIRDYAHFLKVWNSKLGESARALVRQDGNQVSLGTVYRGFRQMTSNRPITGPADLVGLKLRLPPVPTWVAVWTALETVPTTIPLPGLVEALRTGVVEASEGDLSQITSLNLDQVQSHLSLTGHLTGVGWIFANQDFFEGLTLHDRLIVAEVMAEAARFGTERMVASESTLLETLRSRGMTVVTPDAAAIRAKARPAVEELFRTAWPVTTWDEVLAF
jgi:TRAP-type transport system periplasmic protein